MIIYTGAIAKGSYSLSVNAYIPVYTFVRGASSLSVNATVPAPPRVVHTSYENELDEDGDIIVEMLATNLNDAHELRLEGISLVGKSNLGIGAAERITPIAPLQMADRKIWIDDTYDLMVSALDGRVDLLETQVSVLEGLVSTLQGQVSTLQGRVITLETNRNTIDLLLAGAPVARLNLDSKLEVSGTVV